MSKGRANNPLPLHCVLQTGPWLALAQQVRPVRERVFIDEQRVDPALEWDADDATALHGAVSVDGVTVGTARLLASQAGVARIGRMAVLRTHRGQGLGTALLDTLLHAAHERGDHTAVLHAQCHARTFYERAGFAACGEPFIEAGIEHVEMHRPL